MRTFAKGLDTSEPPPLDALLEEGLPAERGGEVAESIAFSWR